MAEEENLDDGSPTEGSVGDNTFANLLNPGIFFTVSGVTFSIPNADLKKEVKKKDYAGIHNHLKTHKNEVDCCIYSKIISLTGLEWALWKDDWKMATLFFVHGADPNHNAFDGVVHTEGSYLGFEDPDILDGFDADDPKPIKGFAGLKLLVNDANEIGKAYLYVMECLYCGAIDLEADYDRLAGCMDILSNDVQYSSSDLKAFILTSFLSMKRMGLSHDIALPIVENVVLGTLWYLLESFATRDIAANGEE